MTSTYTNGASSPIGSTLPAPLRVAPDMTSTWNDVELDFDTAADCIVRAHQNDGQHRDGSMAPTAHRNTASATSLRGHRSRPALRGVRDHPGQGVPRGAGQAIRS